MIGNVLLQFKDELKRSCNLDCEKCARLKDEIHELKMELGLYRSLLDELEELREMCDEKSEIINELLEKIG